MKNSFKDDEASFELVSGFRSEMGEIGTALVALFEREEGTFYLLYQATY
jgi:hypothetical protein